MAKEHLKGTAEEQRSYSPAVKVKGGTTIYLAGVGATNDESGRSLDDGFEGQVRASFERIRKNLETAGGTLNDIVTMTVFIKDMRNGTRFTEIRSEYFESGYPYSALIGISSFARPEMMVEVQAVAVLAD